MAKGLSFNFRNRLLLAAIASYSGEVREVLHPAVRAGAEVLYEEMKRIAPVSKKVRRKGRKTYTPGTLRKSIYHAFSEDNSGESKVTFHVGPNMKKAPHWWLVENGHWMTRSKNGPRIKWVPGKPYIRPTWDTKGDVAVTTMRRKVSELLAARRAGRGRAKS